MTAPLVAVVAALAALGVIVLVSAWSPGRVAAPGSGADTARLWSELARPLVIGLVVGAAALALTGWVVAALAAAAAAVMVARRTAKPGGAKEQQRIEALAGWCEQLRDLLSADYGIVGTVQATVRTCPGPIQPEVARLAARLDRQSPGPALQRFADDLDDPSADLVASVLKLAMARSSRTSELLSELAATIRERAAMRLRIEAERSGQRSEARFVIGFTVIVVAGLMVFGRDTEFMGAYDDGTGQLVLLFVFFLFAGGIRWLSRLTRFERPARFLDLDSTTGVG